MQTTFKKGGAKLLLDLAQLEEHRTVNPGVAGSIPAIETWSYSVVVSTPDFESGIGGSSPPKTSSTFGKSGAKYFALVFHFIIFKYLFTYRPTASIKLLFCSTFSKSGLPDKL